MITYLRVSEQHTRDIALDMLLLLFALLSGSRLDLVLYFVLSCKHHRFVFVSRFGLVFTDITTEYFANPEEQGNPATTGSSRAAEHRLVCAYSILKKYRPQGQDECVAWSDGHKSIMSGWFFNV